MDDSFQPGERLYRGLHSIWLCDGRISSAAFKDSGGVSVDRDGGREEQACIDRITSAMPHLIAVGKLTCQDVEDCGALPKYLPTAENEYHSEIHDSDEQVQIKSSSKARKLANHCQIVHIK